MIYTHGLVINLLKRVNDVLQDQFSASHPSGWWKWCKLCEKFLFTHTRNIDHAIWILDICDFQISIHARNL